MVVAREQRCRSSGSGAVMGAQVANREEGGRREGGGREEERREERVERR